MNKKQLRMARLYDLIKECQACLLSAGRLKFVFGEGSLEALIMFIGEGPGKRENELGRPFVGRSGQLLRKMLLAIGIDPIIDCYIGNIVKCRPPNNRAPEKEEIETCIKYLRKQIEIISPKLLVFLGKTAIKGLCPYYAGFNMESLRMMSKGFDIKYENVPVIVTYHPAALLYIKERRKGASEDFKFIQDVYKKLKS